MAWHWYALRIIQTLEDRIIESILRQPGFHRAVGRIHRTIHERKHGRMPDEPLHPGEATADPNAAERNQSFFKFFRNELVNQFRGKPTDIAEKTTNTKKK